MERAVQHRPDQLGHPGVEDHEHLPSACSLTSTTATASTPAGADDVAARFEDDRQSRVPDRRQQRRGVIRRAVGTGAPSYDTPRPPPRSRCSMRDAVVTQLARRARRAPRRRGAAVEVGDLRTDVAVQPDDLEAVARAALRGRSRGRRRSRCRTCSSSVRSRCADGCGRRCRD